jgi:hypothetical protein
MDALRRSVEAGRGGARTRPNDGPPLGIGPQRKAHDRVCDRRGQADQLNVLATLQAREVDELVITGSKTDVRERSMNW